MDKSNTFTCLAFRIIFMQENQTKNSTPSDVYTSVIQRTHRGSWSKSTSSYKHVILYAFSKYTSYVFNLIEICLMFFYNSYTVC